ncbi:hypothetical protein KP509_09G058900 [Ceratopteris richardii]|uniref:Receptor-like serine/threonine-protein kinase n=1 Tax=Ceratopteris richardii TaxID=49495 RepID=A0A8T2U1L7_CERRI|nr:hypothetical protein KP509_09G058900 [Ceratopteris richardii]KAH7429616.1 hypothetical protein KP509_09G058900 [Ceratopteris richardii]KAH7429617.1 hypothetical protein KP509_09G058900 [Ceratopteris richardii]KAH7429618.1 hypothetical protein KP509_09G058900 [Ceratopteris richardii]
MQVSSRLLCSLLLFWISLSPVLAAQTVFSWGLNQTFSINSSSDAVALDDERSGLSAFLFPSQGESNAGSSDEVVIPCIVAANDSIANRLYSAIFGLCMKPQISAFFSSIDSPYQGYAILWAANRGFPAQGKSLSLTLSKDGDLVFYGDGMMETPAWSSGTSGQGVTRLELTQDPANLKVLDSKNRTIWQSMDHPFDTLSVGQTLQVGMKLVSWNSGNDFSEGRFTLVVEPSFQLKLLYTADLAAEPLPYWIWHPDKDKIPSACRHLEYGSTALASCLDSNGFVNVSQTYSVFLSNDGLSVGSIINDTVLPSTLTENSLERAVLKLDYDGALRIFSVQATWIKLADTFDNDTCLLPTRCGAYGICTSNGQCTCPDLDVNLSLPVPFSFSNASDPSQGCVVAQSLSFNCSTQLNQNMEPNLQMLPLTGGLDYFVNRFIGYNDVQFTDNGTSNLGAQECNSLCLKNCSCLASLWHVDSQTCFHVHGQIGSFRGALNSSNYKAYVKLSVPSPQSPKPPLGSVPPSLPLSPLSSVEGSNSKPMVLGIVIGVGGFLLVCVFMSLLFHRKCYKHPRKWRKVQELDVSADADVLFDLPNRFTFEELDTATNGFSQKLGRGGFGAVYYGTLPNGTRVAVKRLEGLRQGEKEFRSELRIMGGANHHNLLQLIGFCVEEEKRLLVYKFMENGSLDQWLFQSSASLADRGNTEKLGGCRAVKKLSWEMRYNIAVGVAKGLAYLHEGCRKHILHLDIKPQNILLDEDFVPKVADFGLSRHMERNESNVMTTVRGTPGYLAPEWLKEGASVGLKCDVFSYGMLLMQIVSGRRNADQQSGVPYPEWAFSQLQGMRSSIDTKGGDSMRCVDGLTDTELQSDEERQQLETLLIIAYMCVLEKPEWRPSMGTVVQMLEGHISVMDINLSNLRPGLNFVLGSDSSSTDIAGLKRQLESLFTSSQDGSSGLEDVSFFVSSR